MPKLFEYVDRSGFYIVTSIGNNIVTYQLTPEGIERFRQMGTKHGEPFSIDVLLGLIGSGHAYTGRSGPGIPTIKGQGIQPELPFNTPAEKRQESMIPVCADCSSPADLHFVELLGEKRRATLLCFACREKQMLSIDTSIPLPFVTKSLLNRTLAMKGISERDDSVKNYQKLLDMKFEEKWKKVAETKRRSQKKLFDDAKEGKLFSNDE